LIERRKFPRLVSSYKLVLEHRITIEAETSGSVQEAYSYDISLGGLYVNTDQLLPIGTIVKVDIFPKGAIEPLALQAHVVHVEDNKDPSARFGMGLEFIELTSEQEDELKDFLTSAIISARYREIPNNDTPILAPESLWPDTSGAAAMASFAQSNKNVLIIEDDEAVRRMLSHLLTAMGFLSISAADGSSALVLFGSESFALVVADCLLPDYRGPELIAKLRQINHQTPILAISGLFRTKHQRLVFEQAGADDFLLKPFNLNQFKEKVSAILGRQRT